MTTTYDELLERARGLATSGGRRLLGITGAPGVGKSTLAERLVADLAGAAVLVPMDGFHLPNSVLDDRGSRGAKGAPHTFDDVGFAALLRRLVDQPAGEVVHAPAFDRSLDEPVGGAILVDPGVPLVVTEGNYLLLDTGAWPAAAACLDECWFLELDPKVRRSRLVARHEQFGRSPEDAAAWVQTTDEPNAETIAATATRADARIRLA